MSNYNPAADAIPQQKIPYRTLHTGTRLPAIGFGTFSTRYAPEAVAQAVSDALDVGYRFLDCAAGYGNEREIGQVLRRKQDEGLPRAEIFVLSKLWNDMHAPEKVAEACKKTLSDLQLDYLDAYLIHWPVPNLQSPQAVEHIFRADSQPYRHEVFMETWHAMEALVDAGLVRHIGVSNVSIAKMALILRDARIRPAINEMEMHPSFQQGELFQYCLDCGVVPVGYSPVGSPARPERNREAGDVVDMKEAAVVRIAEAHGVHPAEICLKWAVQRGQIPIPFSGNRANILANLRAVTEDPLTLAELNAMRGVDRNSRQSRGAAYLWPGAESWLEMWDIDGRIRG